MNVAKERTVSEIAAAARALARGSGCMQLIVNVLGADVVAPCTIGSNGIGLLHRESGEVIDLTWSFDQG